jgi:hypothetical protein
VAINANTYIQSVPKASVVLYGCETWSQKSREGHRLKVSEKRVLRGILGLKRNEITGGWR